jgi:hypothetical protein
MAKLARVIKKRALLRDSLLSMLQSHYSTYSKHIFTELTVPVFGPVFRPLDVGIFSIDGKSEQGVNILPPALGNIKSMK